MEPKIETPVKKHIKKEIKSTGKKYIKKGIVSTDKNIRKRSRSRRGSGITKQIPLEEDEDDDPFVNCDTQRWSLKTALDHIGKYDPKNSKVGFKSPVTASTFEGFSNTIVVGLFRLYAILETELQNNLHIFYFGLENTNLPRFRNLTHFLHKLNIFKRYPWLTTDEKLREIVDIKELYKKKRKRSLEYSVRKPFSEACKQYEIAKKKCSEIPNPPIDIKIKPEEKQNLSSNVDIPNTSHENLTNSAAEIPQISVNQSDKHLLLSQEYKNMISAINCSYQYNSISKSDEADISEEIPQSSSPSIETPITEEIPTLETKKITYKLTPLMHFENRKIKLITQTSLSLGDLIVLVSYYYKLDYVEQQLLIEKMKILEATKPNQAAYLRQYVRTTCPLYNKDEIQFKQLPQELIMSEINMDLRDVRCIEDILEKDFCISEDQLLLHKEKRIQIDKTSPDSLDDVKTASKEFDFGSAFL